MNRFDRDRVVALFSSLSNVGRQPEAVRAAFAAELRDGVPDEHRVLPLTLELYWTRLRPS